MAKIRQSKEIAAGGGAPPAAVASPPRAESSPSARGVRFSAEPAASFPPPPRRAASSAMSVPKVSTTKATALYDFEAQGEDELTIVDGEDLTVVERENDDWWTVRNASGQQGVVPAQYVEVSRAVEIAHQCSPLTGGCVIVCASSWRPEAHHPLRLELLPGSIRMTSL